MSESGVIPPTDGDSPHPPPLRLARVLRDRHQAEGGWAALQRAIARASGNPKGKREGRHVVDRRKLAGIVNGEDVTLSVGELAAIDRYLEPLGEGLAHQPFFEKPNLIDALAETARVTLLIGARQAGEHWYFSHWDAIALAELQRELNDAPLRPRIDIRDVSVFDKVAATRASLETGGWSHLLGDDGPSLVCIGSGRSSAAAEALLSTMCGVQPYPPRHLTDRTLPFHFVWDPEKLTHVFPSHFNWRSSAVADLHPAAAQEIARGKASAIAFGDELLVDRVRESGVGPTYGICAVQRRRSGQLFIVLAGITGVATLVAAKLVPRMLPRLYEESRGRHSRVHWAVTRAHVEPEPGVPFASQREFADESFHSGFSVWPEDD